LGWAALSSEGKSFREELSKGGDRDERRTLVELLEALELRSETALAGGVDNEDDLALELGEIVDVALLCALRSVSRHSSHHCRDTDQLTVKGLEVVESGSRSHCG
jgi:hypothetical protein